MTIPNSIGNDLVEDPEFINKLWIYIKNTRAESVYFTLRKGKRTAIFIMDIESPKQMYDACESLLMLGGKVQRDMVMTLDDIKGGSE